MAAIYVLAVRELQKCLTIHVRKPLGVRRGNISSPIKSELSRLRNSDTVCQCKNSVHSVQTDRACASLSC